MPANSDLGANKLPAFLKSDLVNLIEDHIYLPKSEVKRFVDLIFHTILTKASEGYRVKLANFGNFHVYTKKPRPGRNPHYGTEVHIPERTILRFKPSLYARMLVDKQTPEHTTTLKKNEELTQVLTSNPFEDIGMKAL